MCCKNFAVTIIPAAYKYGIRETVCTIFSAKIFIEFNTSPSVSRINKIFACKSIF